MNGTILIAHLAASLPQDIGQRRLLLADAIAVLPDSLAESLASLMTTLDAHETRQQQLALGGQ